MAFLQAELRDLNSGLFQATLEEYYDERHGLKALFSNPESVDILVREIALVDPLSYRTHPEYFQEVMNAKGEGSQEGFGSAVTAPVDAVVWAAGALACPSCALEDLQLAWEGVKQLPEELSYKGYLDTLHIMQGGGADVIQSNAASSTGLGIGAGLAGPTTSLVGGIVRGIGARRAAAETVFDFIKGTQPAYPGSVIPKSFEMTLPSGHKVWVHGNATEHMVEYAASKAVTHTPEAVRLTSQVQLESFQYAVNAATKSGVPYGERISIDGWQLEFKPPRAAGELPTIIHARYTGAH